MEEEIERVNEQGLEARARELFYILEHHDNDVKDKMSKQLFYAIRKECKRLIEVCNKLNEGSERLKDSNEKKTNLQSISSLSIILDNVARTTTDVDYREEIRQTIYGLDDALYVYYTKEKALDNEAKKE